MTLSFKLVLNGVKGKQHAKYLGHLVHKILCGHTDIHIGPVALPGPLKWSVNIIFTRLILLESMDVKMCFYIFIHGTFSLRFKRLKKIFTVFLF